MSRPPAWATSERHALIELVKRLVVERGISVLFTEHSMDVVFAFADRIIVLARGRLIADGDAASIRDNAPSAGSLFRQRQDLRRGHDMSGGAMLAVRNLQRLVRRRAHSLRPRIRSRPRRGGGADGAQRRRQVDHHENDHGPDRPAPRRGALQRLRYFPPQAVRDRAPRPRLYAGGPAHLRRPHGDGKSRSRPPAAAHASPTANRRRPGRRKNCSRCFPISPKCPTAWAAA